VRGEGGGWGFGGGLFEVCLGAETEGLFGLGGEGKGGRGWGLFTGLEHG
jgi:hypothetical protein